MQFVRKLIVGFNDAIAGYMTRQAKRASSVTSKGRDVGAATPSICSSSSLVGEAAGGMVRTRGPK